MVYFYYMDFRAYFCGQEDLINDARPRRLSLKKKDLEYMNKLKPDDNKYHRGSRQDGKHYWLTPPELYNILDKEFNFDFDPCPYPLPDGFDGLTCEWGRSNYVNPPFGSIVHEGKKKGATAWARKAITENKKGKKVVMVYPIDKWVLLMIKNGAKIRNLGDIRWHSIEDNKPGKGTGRHIACFILSDKTKEEEIAEIIKDELKMILKIDEKDLEVIIHNIKIRLEKDLTTPEDEKIIKEGL